MFCQDIFSGQNPFISSHFTERYRKKPTLFDFSFALGYSTKPVCGLLFFVVKSADLFLVLSVIRRAMRS
ncbi:MAG: hypothetical protein D3921_05700 [Candidatus Electrothrix sp. AW1]|nr:hypothetical protein [Candidatus Electrothrix gigas]